MNPNSSNVRTFRAADARSALSAVRAALGGEAVILETREVAGGLFGKAQIEVTAAGPVPSAPESRRAAFESAPAAAARGGRRVPVTDLEGEVGALRRLVEEMRHRLPGGGRSNGLLRWRARAAAGGTVTLSRTPARRSRPRNRRRTSTSSAAAWRSSWRAA